jgi:hypothetical protein
MIAVPLPVERHDVIAVLENERVREAPQLLCR